MYKFGQSLCKAPQIRIFSPMTEKDTETEKTRSQFQLSDAAE